MICSSWFHKVAWSLQDDNSWKVNSHCWEQQEHIWDLCSD